LGVDVAMLYYAAVKNAAVVLAILTFARVTAAQPFIGELQSCSQTAVTSAAEQVRSARKNLLALPVGDGLQTDVSPVAQKAVASMKNALSDFVRSYMKCTPAQFDAAAAEKNLMTLVGGYEMPSGEVISNDHLPPDFGKYGFELYFGVRQSESPRLVSITADFSIECGGDTVLLVFSPQDGSWSEVLHWQTKPYTTVAGGTMAFDYGISPVDESGGWYAVVHTIAPWCSSTWSSIRYEVLRPTADALKPRVLMSNSDYMWWGNEDYGKVTVGRNEFDLRFHSSSIDAGVHNRVFIRHYSVMGDTVRRTQPVAVSPRDFVDEWIVSPWSVAREWSSKVSLSELQQAHVKWYRHEKATNRLLEFCSAHKCPGDSYQVEVCEETGKNFNVSHSNYFEVARSGTYTMTRVSSVANPRCERRDLLDENENWIEPERMP
jgi:hypothetical protein